VSYDVLGQRNRALSATELASRLDSFTVLSFGNRNPLTRVAVLRGLSSKGARRAKSLQFVELSAGAFLCLSLGRGRVERQFETGEGDCFSKWKTTCLGTVTLGQLNGAEESEAELAILAIKFDR
jgi:hypothetical protein